MYFVIHKIGECFLSSEYKIVSFLAVVLATIIKTSWKQNSAFGGKANY